MNLQIVIYYILALTTVAFGKSIRIIGGEDAEIEDLPYIVSLRSMKEKEHICSGVIISASHILTAAHCIYDLRKSDIKIFMGDKHSNNFSAPYYDIHSVQIHPRFIGRLRLSTIVHNDIAVITINACIPFNKYQNKISLAKEDIRPDDEAIVAGWGWTRYPLGIISPTLKKITMKIVANSACAKKVPFLIFKEQVCGFNSKGIGTCYGDSGSPMVSKGRVIGISSFAAPCAIGAPDIFSKVYSYLDFIHTAMMDKSSPICCITL